MLKRTTLLAAAALACGLVIGSCSSAVLGARTGTIVLSTGQASGARSLTASWPMGEGKLPVFSTVVVLVSGAGMDTVIARFDSYDESISIEVSPGASRSVSVVAVPDWEATATLHPDWDIPTAASSFSGGAVVDVAPDAIVPVAIRLALSSTRIVLPNPGGDWKLGVADTIASASFKQYFMSGLSAETRYIFDRYGLLYASLGNSVGVFGPSLSTPFATIPFGTSVGSIALCDSTNRLYGYYDNDGCQLYYVDLDDPSRTRITVNEPTDAYFMEGGVAVDSQGFAYAPGYRYVEETTEYGILKLSVGEPMNSISASSLVGFIAFEILGLVDMTIEDVSFVGGVLYILASDINAYPGMAVNSDIPQSRGKVVAVNTSSMSLRWTAGWPGDEYDFPRDPASEFYGPRRIVAISPKKLYVLDSGFSWNGEYYGYFFLNVNRVMELDKDLGQVTARGQESYGLYDVDYSEMYQTYAS